MRKYLKIIYVLILSVWIFKGQDVYASGENIHYGSETYIWNAGEMSQIGVYATGDQNIVSAEIILQYDPEYLEYSSGGELIQPGQVRIVMNEIWSPEGMTMLEFFPVLSGNTEITIVESQVVNEAGEIVDTGNVEVGVLIPAIEGSNLEQILVNDNAIEGFSPDRYRYDLEVDSEVENASISILPEGRKVNISDTTLAIGQNRINITSQNEMGNRTRYELNIMRKEVEETKSTEDTENPQAVTSGPQTIMEANPKSASNMQLFLIISIIVLLVLLIFLIWLKLYLAKKAKKRYIRQAREERKRAALDKSLQNGMRIGNDVSDDGQEVEISVQQVTMEFKREKDESSSIKELLIRSFKGQRSYEWFRALNRVSFDVKKGEVVGIIGTNGSGKSTLLKIISGVLQPTAGRVVTDPKKIQLLTLGTGFDMELTGKENVYLNGAIIGYSKEYIDEHYNEIVEFAELEGFMEERVKNYSSGMVSRLGFAIATMRDTPEILILDEVLSVGDIFFRKKSEAKIKEMIHGGSTVLIVSHSTSVIRNNCTKAVWIEKGVLKGIGDPKEVCAAYEKMNESY